MTIVILGVVALCLASAALIVAVGLFLCARRAGAS